MSTGIFKATGWNPMFGGLASSTTTVIALPATVFFFILVCRKIYEKTGNPCLGGFVSGATTLIIGWTVCEIRVPEQGAPLSLSGVLIALIVIGIVVVIGCIVYFCKHCGSVKVA